MCSVLLERALVVRFVLAAVSPAVVVPGMLHLNKGYYGFDKGVPTLVTAAASVDDVYAISAFSVVNGIAFATGSPVISTIFVCQLLKI